MDKKLLKIAKQHNKSEDKEHDLNDILFKNRHIKIYDDIDPEMAKDVCSKIIMMDMESDSPITIWINSEGGCVFSALSMINNMLHARSPIHTIINGIAFSAAAWLAICGDKRFAFTTSSWGQHPTQDYHDDYIKFVKDRMRFGDKIEAMIDKMHKEKTKLTERDIEKYQNGELWLRDKQLLRKGIVDELIEV